MIVHQVTQGSQEWLDLRSKHFTASEAPAMMGASKYMTRDQLLREKSTGERPEINSAQQALFDRGHAAEAAIRPHVEAMIDDELFPVTATDGADLLASFDGITFDDSIIFEHKLLNTSLVAQIEAGELEPHYYWQLEQQLLVSGADKVIFVASDGTPESMRYMWYLPVEGRAQKLIRGWEQFKQDLESYEHKAAPVAPEADPIEAFPALSVALVGEVKSSNLPVFRSKAMAFIESINTDLQTDEDFANAEEAVKFCDRAEKEIDLVKQQALAQTNTIDELFRTMDSIRDQLRQKRLTLDKLVKSRKESLKAEIINEARQKLLDDISKANEEFQPIVISGVTADFPGAAKNKRTFSSLRSAVNDELTRARLHLAERRDHIRASIKIVRDAGDDYRFLFNDLQQLVDRPHDYVQLTVSSRISEHKAEQQRKIEAEAQRRAEEIARAEREEALRQAAEEADTRLKAEAERQAETTCDAGEKIVEAAQPRQPSVIDQAAQSYRTSNPKAATRPTDDQIIEVLALHYRVHESKVIEWLCNMDLDSAGDRMVTNM